MPWKVNWRLVVFSVLVCIASGVVGMVFGMGAGALYHMEVKMEPGWLAQAPQAAKVDFVVPGLAFGGVSGVLAGLLWCGIMVLRVLPASTTRIIWSGVLWGLVVGVMSTCILHLGLKMLGPPIMPSQLGVGLLFGVPAGAIMGVICGAILAWVARPPLPLPGQTQT